MTTDSLEQAAQELVDALMPLLDNADGYDKSTVRTAFLAQRPGDVLRTGDIPRLLVAEEVARHAWKSLTEALLSRVAQQQEKVTRVELIDHRNDRHSGPLGRAFVAWDCTAELSYQDGGRTLKVFVSNPVPVRTDPPGLPISYGDTSGKATPQNPQYAAPSSGEEVGQASDQQGNETRSASLLEKEANESSASPAPSPASVSEQEREPNPKGLARLLDEADRETHRGLWYAKDRAEWERIADYLLSHGVRLVVSPERET